MQKKYKLTNQKHACCLNTKNLYFPVFLMSFFRIMTDLTTGIGC